MPESGVTGHDPRTHEAGNEHKGTEGYRNARYHSLIDEGRLLESQETNHPGLNKCWMDEAGVIYNRNNFLADVSLLTTKQNPWQQVHILRAVPPIYSNFSPYGFFSLKINLAASVHQVAP